MVSYLTRRWGDVKDIGFREIERTSKMILRRVSRRLRK